MAKYNLSIRYAGDEVEQGRISIDQLAPSLLALSKTFKDIQRTLNPAEQPISLDITATQKGSFVVDLILASGPDLLKQAFDILTSKQSQSLEALGFYVTSFAGVINFIIKSYHKKIKSKETKDEGQIKINFSDGTSIVISQPVFELYMNVEVRQAIHDTLEPLDSGVEKIELYAQDEKPRIQISESDYKAFSVPKVKDKELEPVVSEVYLQIVNVAFEHGKWKFYNGTNSFFAKIEDKDFISSVERNEYQFGSTDSLKVRLRTEQFMTEGGLKSEFFIEKVLEHIPGAKQIELDFDDLDE